MIREAYWKVSAPPSIGQGSGRKKEVRRLEGGMVCSVEMVPKLSYAMTNDYQGTSPWMTQSCKVPKGEGKGISL